MEKSEKNRLRGQWLIPASMAIGVLIVFYAVLDATSYHGGISLTAWIKGTWNSEAEFEHAWAVPILFIVFIKTSWKTMSEESINSSGIGLVFVSFGLLLYVASARAIQPRLAFIGLPFLIFGSVYFVYGWKVARHMLFPAFFWYFAIPMPALQQATNVLQLFVSKSCYAVGSLVGMQLTLSGNDINSATGSWESLNIAEGCSGIRSLMALVMISAIYAYLTQKKLWKMAFLFACALPLAVLANFLRIFTIIVLAEFGFSEFAAGVYHDWAGLLFFFPIALAGLFLIDRLLNWKEHRKVVQVRTVGGDDSMIR